MGCNLLLNLSRTRRYWSRSRRRWGCRKGPVSYWRPVPRKSRLWKPPRACWRATLTFWPCSASCREWGKLRSYGERDAGQVQSKVVLCMGNDDKRWVGMDIKPPPAKSLFKTQMFHYIGNKSEVWVERGCFDSVVVDVYVPTSLRGW